MTGNAFGSGPAKGKLGNQQDVTGFKGKWLVNTFMNGDGATGTLTSPVFQIERKYIKFLIGGGSHKNTALQLLIDGDVVTFRSGGSDEHLVPECIDVSKYVEKPAQIRIVDNNTGGWGHVNVDNIVQSDEKPKTPILGHKSKEFVIKDKYLIMPIQNKAKGRKAKRGNIKLIVDGQEVRSYGINLATSEGTTDWYAFFTIDSYKGKQAKVEASLATEEGFELVKQSNVIPGEENLYKEPYRPQFHLTQKVGWINDPNGMVYHNGTWHFFFQHNPVSLSWGNMTWGHATSKDLVHWEQHPNKLFPQTMARGACFSGGATVDKKNSAGWGANTLVAFFTDTGVGECIAYSSDNGKTFTYYKDNPVIAFKETPGKPHHKGRDPKVIWYEYAQNDTPLNNKAKELGGHWVMVVFDERKPCGRNAAFYTSTNMKDWTLQQNLPGYFECPELFELPVDGDKNNTKWVIFAADAKYAMGQFDGKKFTPEHKGKYRVHYGPYYASQTFDNSPDGRKIQMGWTKIAAPGPYNQHFSFPECLTLHNTSDGVRMFVNPVKEIESLRIKTNHVDAQNLTQEKAISIPVTSDLLDVTAEIEVGNASMITIKVPGRTVKYDVKKGMLNGAKMKPVNGKITIRILADRLITEIVGNEGRVFITAQGKYDDQSREVTVTASAGNAKLLKLEAHELKSIWNKSQKSVKAGSSCHKQR